MKTEYNIDELLNTIDFTSNQLNKTTNNLYLTQKEISILKSYEIDYNNCLTLKELLYKIEQILKEEDSEDLEQISISIAERDYYQNTNK